MEKDLDILQQYLTGQHPGQAAVWQALRPHWQPVVFKRKTLLTAAGETERYLYFVLEGIQRVFFVGPDHQQEATIVFTYPPSFSGVADSFLTQRPSPFYLETLTATRMLRLSHERFVATQNQYPEFKDLMIDMLGQVLQGVLLRLAEIQSYSAEERFRSFLTRSPHMLNLVPHKYLASYLSIDPSTFSRLLSSVKL